MVTHLTRPRSTRWNAVRDTRIFEEPDCSTTPSHNRNQAKQIEIRLSFRAKQDEKSEAIVGHLKTNLQQASARTIGLMSRRYDLTLRTLRFYEQIGLLFPTRAGNQRFYTSDDETRIQIVGAGKTMGLSLRDIKSLIEDHIKLNRSSPRNIADLLDIDTLNRRVKDLETQRSALDNTIMEMRTAAMKMRERQSSSMR